MEKDSSEKSLEIKELNSKIQDIINEKEKEKALEIKAINNEHRKEIDIIKDEYNTKIQELNEKLTTLQAELQIIRSNTAKKEDE